MDFESLDWEAEAKRVEAAFEIGEECEFAQFIRSGRTFAPRNRDAHWEYSHSPRNFQIVVFYSPENRRYSCVEEDEENAELIGLGHAVAVFDWNGKVSEIELATSPHGPDVNEELARAIFHLGLLTTEVEQALEVHISAHEKLEWARQYERLHKFDNPL